MEELKIIFSWKHYKNKLANLLSTPLQNREQLVTLLENAKNEQILDGDAFDIIEGALKISSLQVRDIMVPRSQMTVIEHDKTPQEALPIIVDSAHSRFPVIGESREEVLGILLAKDLLPYIVEEKSESIKIKDLLRPAIFIPESKRLDALLKEFRLKHNHMAIIVNEYGVTSGLVTMEDILEQIVGHIGDEYDTSDDEPNIKSLNQSEYIVRALTKIDEFNDYFSTQIQNEDFDTLGGYVMQQLGHVPKRGETVNIGSFELKVLSAGKRQIQLLHVTKIPHENPSE